MRKASRYMARRKAQLDARNRMRRVEGPTQARPQVAKVERSA